MSTLQMSVITKITQMLLHFSNEIIFIKQKQFGEVIKEERKTRKRGGEREAGRGGEGRSREEENGESLDADR